MEGGECARRPFGGRLRHLRLLAPGVVVIPHFLVAGRTGAAHLVAVAHLVVEFLGFVGLQLLGIGQLGGTDS